MKKLIFALTLISVFIIQSCNIPSAETINSNPQKTRFDELLNEVAQQQDPIITMPPSQEITELGSYIDAKAIGILAYEWGYALVRMEQTMRDYIDVPEPKPETSYRAPLNQIGWARRLPTAKDKDMPTANNDTYYLSAVVDLTEPYILETPNTNDRYFVVNVFDMYQNLTDYIGRRTTGTEAGKFAIVPEGWQGNLPKGINKTITVRTQKTWLWGRIHVLEGEDISKVHELQDQFTLKPLSEYLGKEKTNYPSSLPEMEKYPVSDSLRFYKSLAFAISQNTIFDEDRALVGQLERIGIKDGKFDISSLNKYQIKGLKEAALEGPLAIIATTYSSSNIINGWLTGTKLDNFGYDYAFRSLVSGPYLGGQGEKEAMYPGRYVDSENKVLVGSNSYEIKFDQEPPVNSFWSLTLYEANSKLFYDNELDRYKFSRESKGLKINADGSFNIIIQNKKPEQTDNWLPAPEGEFYLIMRLYQPKEEVIRFEYQLPQIEKKL